jgi:hypothetical protein
MRAIVTTTIHDPVALGVWAKLMADDDVFIIAGDRKTPHDRLRTTMNEFGRKWVYIDPTHPSDFASHDVTGYNVIQRRNLATLEALRCQPDYVIFIDDDNVPVSATHLDRLDDILRRQTLKEPLVWSPTGWFDVYREISIDENRSYHTHRGYPHWMRHVDPETIPTRVRHGHTRAIGVVASAVLGDPDIDAVERICCAPVATDIKQSVVLEAGTWHPFNSQATAVRTELVPFMHMWLKVGRFDDIWASYLMRVVMDSFGWHVHHGTPVVYQDRNEHDLNVDLLNETYGYDKNAEIVATLRKIAVDLEEAVLASPHTWAAPRLFSFITERLGTLLPSHTRLGFEAWLSDLELLRDEHGVEFRPLRVQL